MPSLFRDYVDTGKVRFVMREYPIERLHPRSVAAAEAVLCADDQGQYWDMHDALFADQKSTSDEHFQQLAERIGLGPLVATCGGRGLGPGADFACTAEVDAQPTIDFVATISDDGEGVDLTSTNLLLAEQVEQIESFAASLIADDTSRPITAEHFECADTSLVVSAGQTIDCLVTDPGDGTIHAVAVTVDDLTTLSVTVDVGDPVGPPGGHGLAHEVHRAATLVVLLGDGRVACDDDAVERSLGAELAEDPGGQDLTGHAAELVGRAPAPEEMTPLAVGRQIAELVEQISADEFRPENYEDEVRNQTWELIERKVQGEEIVAPPQDEPKAQIVDLMEALKARLGEGEERKPAKRSSRGPAAEESEDTEASS